MDQHRLLMQRVSCCLLRLWPPYNKASLLFLLSLLIVTTFASNLASDAASSGLSLMVGISNTTERDSTWRPLDGTSTVLTLRRLSETEDSLPASTTTSTVATPARASTSTSVSTTSSGALRKWAGARDTGNRDAAARASHTKSTTTSTPAPKESTTTLSFTAPSSTAPRKAEPLTVPPYPTGAKPLVWPADEGIMTGQGTPHWGTSAMPPQTYHAASFSRDRMARPPLFSGQGRIFNNGPSTLPKPTRMPSLQPLSSLSVQPSLNARPIQAGWPTASSSSSLRGWLTH